jgi:hypothetical protein
MSPIEFSDTTRAADGDRAPGMEYRCLLVLEYGHQARKCAVEIPILWTAAIAPMTHCLRGTSGQFDDTLGWRARSSSLGAALTAH